MASIRKRGDSWYYTVNLGFDPTSRKVILMGGADAQGTHYRDTWSWDGAGWTRLGEGPAISPNAQMVATPGGGLGTFGGWDGSHPSRTLFRWNGTGWETRAVTVGPSARMETALSFDQVRGRLILFGGSDANGSKLNDLWEYDGVEWKAAGRTSSVSDP